MKPLSDRARSVWAKSRVDPSPPHELSGWLPLHQHLADAAAVGGYLWDEWCPVVIKRRLTQAIGSEAAARSLVVWLAGIHDVGKASPAFAVQVPALADDMRAAGLPIDARIKESTQRGQTRHELVSFLAARHWLEETHGFIPTQAIAIASVAAAHHGKPASHMDADAAASLSRLIGSGAWHDVREEFLTSADALYSSTEAIDAWRLADLRQPDLVLLSGLVIVADWLASSDEFDGAPLGAQPDQPTAERAARAWRNLDFPRPWRSAPATMSPAELLRRRFSLPEGAEPRPAQAAFVEEALHAERPELMILEAEMGSGKTEAALLAAEILAARFGMGGIFVGLPTQATADAMFSRVLQWAEMLDLDVPSTVFLARGKSELNPDFAERTSQAFRSIAPDGRGADAGSDSLVIAHRWFTQPRRGPLSNFVVGTIDQALFAGLRSRYVMLRHLALASKVVVIDEAHAYDDYMEEFLTRVLEWLGAYGTPVVMLSATLPSQRRRDFLEAYDRGRDALKSRIPTEQMTAQERRALAASMLRGDRERYKNVEGRIGYPVIAVSDGNGAPHVVTPVPVATGVTVTVEWLDDDLPRLRELLTDALRDGGNIAVVRNTVRRAQETATFLRAAFPDIPVTLAHSRFLVLDRARKDRELLEKYGPKGERPRASIVVATQVIEQSLDVDFDLVVTDVAPIDLLLQRIGRLHRHSGRDRPEPLRHPRLVTTGVDRAPVPPEPDRGSQHVYERAILLKTLAALEERASIALPDDIAPLVETVYAADDAFIPDAWRAAVAEADRQRERRRAERRRKAQSFTLDQVGHESASLLGWITGPDVDPELTPPGRATVRDGDETLEVIVVQRGADGIVRTPDWLGRHGGVQLPDNEPPRGALSRTLLGCALRLPAGMCHGNAIDRHIRELERRFEFPTWQGSHALKGELALVLDHAGDAVLNEFDLHYTPENGLEYVDRSRARQ